MTQLTHFEKPTTQKIGNDIFIYQPEEARSGSEYKAPLFSSGQGMEAEQMPVRVQKLLTHLQEIAKLEATRSALETLDQPTEEVEAPVSLEGERLKAPNGFQAKQILLQRMELKQHLSS